LRKCR